MSELILGVNSCGYNTSSALLRNGEVLFAVEEERIIRDKRTRKFPIRGIEYGLKKTYDWISEQIKLNEN